MKIKWTLKKPRGTCPPVLDYTCTPDALDLDLCVQCVSSITVDGYKPSGTDVISQHAADLLRKTPSAILLKLPTLGITKYYEIDAQKLYLPWRQDGDYSYVPQLMLALMAEWESALILAINSLPVDLGGWVEYSDETRERIAPVVAARRMGVEPDKY